MTWYSIHLNINIGIYEAELDLKIPYLIIFL